MLCSVALRVMDLMSLWTLRANSGSKSLFVFGVVYKTHDPHDVYLDATGVVQEKCYVGKTELTRREIQRPYQPEQRPDSSLTSDLQRRKPLILIVRIQQLARHQPCSA